MRRALVLALVLGACTGPAPTGQSLLLRIDVSEEGSIDSIHAAAVDPSDVPLYARPRQRGELLAEVLASGEVMESGRAYVTLFDIAEDFQEMAIVGERVPTGRIVYLELTDDGRDEVPVRVTLDLPGRDAVTVERDVAVLRPTASTEGLREASGDVGARTEALSLCGIFGFLPGCDEPEEDPDICEPMDPWDNEVVELVAGSSQTQVLVPLGWDDPDEFEEYARSLVETMHFSVDWFSENEGVVGFSVWRANCELEGGVPDFSSRGAAFSWMTDVAAESELLPPADRYIVIANTETAQGRASYNGQIASVGVYDSVLRSAAVLAHELGHAIAGLADEYDYGGSADCSDERPEPNIGLLDSPKWFCSADDGQVYAGQGCGPHGGLVGANQGPISSCATGAVRPCDSSLMRQTWDGAQFDPIGYGAMTYGAENGERLGFEDCGASCDDDCTSVPAGSCGFNGCFNLCNNCPTGERCGMGAGGGTSCRAECPPGGDDCRSSFGFEFCDGESAITTSAMCGGMMLQLVECIDGDIFPVMCIE